MPNRIIKESICTSEKLNQLTDFQFRVWVHLITYVDDYGIGDARPAIIRGTCFPFRDRITNKDIDKVLAELADAGCVELYTVEQKPYLYLPGWEKHQRVRTKVSKFPGPEKRDCCMKKDDFDDLQHSAASCGNLPQDAARIQNPESESRIQNPNPEITAHPCAARDFSAEFDIFWKEYPRKAGDKEKAYSAFCKANVPLDVLLNAIKRQKSSSQWQKPEFIPHPTTWLNGKRWEDEIPAASGIPKGASGILGDAEMDAIRRVLEDG